MSNEVSFIVPGIPIAKGRPRVCQRGGHARTYTPARTKKYENQIALIAQDAMRGRDTLTGPLFLHARCFWPCPVSKQRKRDPAQLEWRDQKPDLDNVCKSLMDGCNAIVYADDSQIVRLYMEKYQQAQGKAPEVILSIKQLSGG